MIVAVAGRRIDASDSTSPRFPLANVDLVRKRVRDWLEARASGLVSSAACGADLIALEVAHELRLRCRVVLPFEKLRFRETSVIDRPGNWGEVFDRVLDDVERKGDLVTLESGASAGEDDSATYVRVNRAIVNEAISLATQQGKAVAALRIWDGKTRGAGDLTEDFGHVAQALNLAVNEISTR